MLQRNPSLLQGSNVTFHGFSEQQERASHHYWTVQSAESRPGIIVRRNVIAMPAYQALYTMEGERIDESSLAYLVDCPSLPARTRAKLAAKLEPRTPSRISLSVPEEVIDRPVAFLGAYIQHYGHFLLEGMSRMWALRKLDPQMAFVRTRRRLNASVPDLAEQHDTVCRPLGMSDGRIVDIARPTLLREVYIPLPSINHSYNIYHAHRWPHQEVARRVAGTPPARTYDRPVYLTRSRLGGAFRKIRDEEKLEAELVARGFEVVAPETLSLREQIALFCQCPLIVGPIGSAFHTALFEIGGRERTRVLLSEPLVTGRFLMIDEIMQAEHRSIYINALTRLGSLNGRAKEMALDVGAAIEALRAERIL